MSENKGQIERLNAYSRLIEMQCGKAVRPYRADGYINMLNRYGTSKDTTEQYRFNAEPQIPDDLLTTFYEGNGLFARIIDAPSEEAVKHGFSLKDLKDNKIEDFYTEALDELDWEETAMTALKWTRLFGGAIAVMLIDDGGTLDQPLNWRNIKSIDDIRVFDRSRIQPDTCSMFHWSPQDPFRTRGSRLGMPEYYDVFSKYGNFRVHDSRCLVFRNGILPENTTNSIYQLWGMPEYIRIHRAIRDAELAHGNAVKMLDRAIQAVYKMKDLSALLATEQGEGQVLRRLQTIDMARGLLNSITIDTEGEDYDFRTFQLSGVNEVIDAACNYLSALTSIPQSILFGRSPAGMNSTGKSDLENWYNSVERIQKRNLKSNLRYLLSVIFQAGIRTGEIDEIPKIKVDFKPLWSLSETEEADLELKKVQTQQAKAQTVQIYHSMQAIDSTEVRKNLADSKEFDIESMLDEYEDEELFPPEMMGGDPAMGDPSMGNPGAAPQGPASAVPAQNDPAQYSQKPSVEAHNGAPGDTGNAPAAAPAATKLPEDKAPLEVATEAAIDQTMDETKVINQDGKPQSVGVLVISDGKILSGTRHNDFGYGLVCGPGGHVEPSETPEEAAFRETEEEFGIKPLSLMYLGKGKKEPDTGLTPDLFLCTEYEGEVNCQDLEMTGAKFRTLEELDELAASMFQPFADGLEVLMMCLETCLFFSDEEEGLSRDKLVETIGGAMQDATEKKDGGPGSGNHGHKGVPGQVGGSAPSSRNGRPSKRVKSSETSLSQEARSKANDSVKKLRSEIFKCKEIQDNANPKAKDYDPTPFIEAEKRRKEIKAEVQTLLDEMPTGTLIEKKRVLYEKNDGGKWIATTCEKSYDASSFIAQEVCGIGDTTDKYPARFIESTEDVVQIEDIKLKSDATYREYSEKLNGMAKKDLVKFAKKNPEFKELVDSIVMYTEGGYVEQRKAFESVSKNGLEGVSAQTVGEHVNGDLYTYRNLWKGQNLEESDANISEGMVTIAKAIEHSDPYDGELYRVAQDRNIYKSNGNYEPYIPPKVGDTITITAPTSFTSDLAVEQELSKQKNGDVIHYVLESGAKAVNVSELSRYKQKEFLSCGKFEVVQVDTQTKRSPLYLREGDEPSYALQKRGIKEDEWGQKYFDIYDTKVTIRYVGDAPIGSRDDADSSDFMIDQGHFEDRMILHNEDEHQTDGGPGSGNFGHGGRPGKIGGSVATGNKIDQSTADKMRSTMMGSSNAEARAKVAKATEGYTGTFAAMDLNRELRKASPQLDAWQQERVEMLDGVMGELPEHISVVRGVMMPFAKEVLGLKGNESQKKLEKKLIGQDFVEKGYMSTSYDADRNRAPWNDVIMNITAKKGTKAVITSNDDEAEILFARGTQCKITGVKLQEGGVNGTQIVLDVETMTSNEDGGPGSGNWGHEGRPGEVGGSAEGGGSHNRMGNKKEGFTSFSKNKKKFAKPHKASEEEYENCPSGSIVVDSNGKWKKGNDEIEFINVDTGELKYYWELAIDNEDKEVRILVPDDKNPNFKKMKVRDDERFSKDRKAKAFQTSNPAEADEVFREQTGKVWRELDTESRYALNGYTYMDYMDINPALRGTATASEMTQKKISRITKAIDKCEMQQDTYLYRGVDRNALSAMLGVTYKQLISGEPARFVGLEITDKAFMSCGTAEGKGFDGSGVYMKIYCPKGTKAMYAEPFSSYGNGDKVKWDGSSGQTSFSVEFETILQRGTRMQITGAKKSEYGNYEIECQVIAQEYE